MTKLEKEYVEAASDGEASIDHWGVAKCSALIRQLQHERDVAVYALSSAQTIVREAARLIAPGEGSE